MLKKIEKDLHITQLEDWNSISKNQFIKHGGRSLLRKHGGSIKLALSALYNSNIKLKDKVQIRKLQKKNKALSSLQLRYGYWGNQENQKNFLNSVAKKFNINHPSHWGNITKKHIHLEKGYGLLLRHGGSLLRALQSVFPGRKIVVLTGKDIKWAKEWFQNLPKYSVTFWKNKENQREFMNKIAKSYNIRTPNDWQRVTVSLIKMKGGQVFT